MARVLGDLSSQPKEKVVFNAPFITDQYTLVRLTNEDTSRIGYRVKTEDPHRLGALQDKGLLHPGEHVDLRVDYRKFAWTKDQQFEDRLIVEWAEVPPGVVEFKPSWFDVAVNTRRRFIPIAHNL